MARNSLIQQKKFSKARCVRYGQRLVPACRIARGEEFASQLPYVSITGKISPFKLRTAPRNARFLMRGRGRNITHKKAAFAPCQAVDCAPTRTYLADCFAFLQRKGLPWRKS